MMRRPRIGESNSRAVRLVVCLIAITWVLHQTRAPAAERINFATNWKAQAEHGGFYQAVADGTYAKFGLEVTIKQGGPMVNSRALLAAGRVEFLMGSNLIQSFDAVKQGLPSVVVGATFQKDAHCLVSHPDQGNDTWDDLKNAPLLLGNAGKYTYLRWLVAAHGFSDSRVRPYTFNLAPFVANKKLVQQAFVTAEPMRIAEMLGCEPNVFLLADQGWSTYSTLIVTRKKMVAEQPEVVQSFVDASILGWVNYLYGDRRAADALIKRDNPEMPQSQIDYSVRVMKDRGIVDSGDAMTNGIGAMSRDRIAGFLQKMVNAGVYEQGEVDATKAYTLRFVNKGVGLELKRKLLE